MKDCHLFVYGTLVLSEVMEAVTGERFASVSAVLQGYGSYLVIGKPYPALVPVDGERTSGRLYLDVPALAVRRLDRFEGELYERRSVRVECGSVRMVAEAFVLSAHARDRVGEERWDEQVFRRDHLPEFLATCHELPGGEGPP